VLTIHLHNYEAFLLDYSEGNLSPADITLLRQFIVLHPELKIELEEFDLPYLEAIEEVSDIKNSLKKTDESLLDETLINYLENNLSKEEQRAFEIKLGWDTQLAKDLELYQKTQLKPDGECVYESKQKLYRSEDDLIMNNRLIAFLENQLTDSEKNTLEKDLAQNAALAQEYALLSKTVLEADLTDVFPDKESLKKQNKVFVLFGYRSLSGVAAAVLLMLGFAFLYAYYQRVQPVVTDTDIVAGSASVESPVEEEDALPLSASVLGVVPLPEKTVNKARVAPLAAHKKSVEPNNKINPSKTAEEKEAHFVVHENDSLKDKSLIEITDEKKELVAKDESKPVKDSSYNKQNQLVLLEELIDEEDIEGNDSKREKKFWKRAVRIASQANKLGVKSIDGTEADENKFSLSFYSFSVGKK
jgi:hypothetical protein